jgi:hypothetical protein
MWFALLTGIPTLKLELVLVYKLVPVPKIVMLADFHAQGIEDHIQKLYCSTYVTLMTVAAVHVCNSTVCSLLGLE